MKKTVWICVALLVTTLILLWLVISRSVRPELSEDPTVRPSEQKNANSMGQATAHPALTGLDPEIRESAARVYEEGVKSNVPIRFYGKVIDQDGVGISRVQVKAKVVAFDEGFFSDLNATTDQKVTPIELVTDDQGQFSLENIKGQSVNIEVIKKEGFESQLKYGKGFYYSEFHQDIHRPNSQ